MALKKKSFSATEVAIYDDAVAYKRGDIWQFRMWLSNEKKDYRKSLGTKDALLAVEKAKRLYIQIQADINSGKTQFSISVSEAIQRYLGYRKRDVESGHIVKGRHKTIGVHLKHWEAFVGSDTKIKELDRQSCFNYALHRESTAPHVSQTTIANEQSTINACMKWLYDCGDASTNGFEFKKLKKIDTGINEAKRQTLSVEEYGRLYTAMRSYVAKGSGADAAQIKLRQIIRHYILIAANTGLRSGEQTQLRWRDVQLEDKEVNGASLTLARIRVIGDTSKVQTTREFLCRNGQYFRRLHAITGGRKDDLVFSVDGKTRLRNATIGSHFKKLLKLAGITDAKDRKIVPYSLRHFMITQRVMAGLSYADVAKMCGTSVLHIEKTYYHLNDEMMLRNAVADYITNDDGTIVRI